jgi:hypothetical protein
LGLLLNRTNSNYVYIQLYPWERFDTFVITGIVYGGFVFLTKLNKAGRFKRLNYLLIMLFQVLIDYFHSRAESRKKAVK